MSEKKRILIIDDEPDILVILTYRLNKAGYEVITADTATEGLRIMSDSGADLILCDMNLPDMHGDILCEMLRADLSHANVPIVILSAGGEELRAKAINCGAKDFLSKPCEPELLLSVLRTHLNS